MGLLTAASTLFALALTGLEVGSSCTGVPGHSSFTGVLSPVCGGGVKLVESLNVSAGLVSVQAGVLLLLASGTLFQLLISSFRSTGSFGSSITTKLFVSEQ